MRNTLGFWFPRGSAGSVFIPLLAIMVVTLLGMALVFGVNTLVVYRASRELQSFAVISVRNLVADNTMLQSNLVRKFVAIINTKNANDPIGPPQMVSLTRARLISPTMPPKDSGRFDLFDGGPGSDTFSVGSLTLDCGATECSYADNVNDSDPDKYPPHLWNNVDNAGNTVGVELEADVRVFPFGLGVWKERGIARGMVRTIRARAVAWKRVRGDYTGYLPYSHGETSGTQIRNAPGLTIAIAPHLQTDANSSDFLFPYASASEASWGEREERAYNPLNGSTYFLTSPPDRVFSVAGKEVSIVGTQAIPSEENQKQMVAACMNPVVLARNAYLAAAVEMASRHGQLRATTEILVVGTQNRQGSLVPNAGQFPTGANTNGPITIVEYGQDLTALEYEAPYFGYDSGSATGTNMPITEFGGHKSGKINPTTAAPTSPWRKHHALIAGQLRYCLRLYRGGENPGLGIQRYSLRPSPDESLTVWNFGFEDPDVYGFRKQLADWADGFWDLPQAPGLSAAEVVSSLGSIQHCPYSETGSGGSLEFCTKPPLAECPSDVGTCDLRPDILGLVQYLAGEAKRVPAVGVSVFTDAPGLLPPDNTISPVLLVTHQRLGESEAQAVKTVVSDTRRQYFVAYFPATPEDNSEEAVRNLREAFRVLEDLGASNPNANQLRIFAPKPGTPAGEYGTYFVESALNPEDPEYVVNRAIRGLFVDQGLLRAELKF